VSASGRHSDELQRHRAVILKRRLSSKLIIKVPLISILLVLARLRPSVDFGIQMCSVAGARLPLADVA
jgi:hypothetical protein